MNLYKFLGIILIFILGIISTNFINSYLVNELENPFNNFSSNITWINSKEAPSDFINENQIEISPDRVIIYVKNASLSSYAKTGSMKPVLDENSNGIKIKPVSEEEINIGDIITFQEGNYLVIHRVIQKGSDENGIYFITKGDDNNVSDEKIRFKDIRYKTIALIY